MSAHSHNNTWGGHHAEEHELRVRHRRLQHAGRVTDELDSIAEGRPATAQAGPLIY